MIQARKLSPVLPAPQEQRRTAPSVKPRPCHRGKIKLIFIGVSCFLLCLTVVAQYSRITSLHYELSSVESRLRQLDEERRKLELEAASLASLSRIETMARGELGMREPEGAQLRLLTANQGN